MTVSFTVFVNEHPVQVPGGASMAEAVAALDAALAAQLDHGAQLTDGRGIALDPAAAAFPGAIVRVIVSARRPAEATDAHA
jgi:ABC-type uncharacterized transport system permease subunit